ncbi:MAG: hypothetical protein ACTSPV_11740 [Candidatus Hodarchaeales archaeon]
MKGYLRAIILEQINRALCLKNLIYPVKYQELEVLAERCTNIIDTIIHQLRLLLSELENRNEHDIRDIQRALRRHVREIEIVESYGVSALYYANDEIRYMNRLIHKIHKEINIPLSKPSVACISTRYYYFHPFTNVIFVPVGESNFILHLPDAFHEMGHYVLYNRENTLRLRGVNKKYNMAIRKITEYYQKLLTQKIRETGPEETPRLIMHIHSQWKEYWINEFFCDLFALYILGPAYAWSHLHLTIKKSEDVYKFSTILPQTHPSDDSRMRMLLIGLNRLGFHNEASLILSKWNSMPLVLNTEPAVEYQYAYPEDLMKEVAELFLEGLEEGNFPITSPDNLKEQNSNSIIRILNDAWTLFWENPDTFRVWEEKTIQKIKSVVCK